jgi:HAD superfamily hydrolase (TIGR01509 family)
LFYCAGWGWYNNSIADALILSDEFMSMRKEYCVLFDSDGTLVDSEPLCHRGISRMFAELGVALNPVVTEQQYRGWQLDTMLQQLSTDHDVELGVDFVQRYRATIAELFVTDLQVIPGVESVLQSLDCAVAVVSSGPPAKIRQALEVTDLARYFGDNIYSAYDIGIWKPDPQIFIHAARDMGFLPENCIAVDDSDIGVEAAVGSGATTLFLNRFDEPNKFSKAISVASMAEVGAFLAEYRGG